MTEQEFDAFLEQVQLADEAHGLALPFEYDVPTQVADRLTDVQREEMAAAMKRDIVEYFGTWEDFIGVLKDEGR